MATFGRPNEALFQKSKYSPTEVGLTHQSTPAYIRLCDNGDIEIMAGEGIGLVLHAANKSVTIIADSIKMMTREDGLRWNDHHFNPNGSEWTEPALLKKDLDQMRGVFDGIEDYIGGE
jgi:hypothetical protein